MLVLRYESHLVDCYDAKLSPWWEGLFVVYHRYQNGSYQLQDLSRKLHRTRVNGWRLKPYFSRMEPRSQEGGNNLGRIGTSGASLQEQSPIEDHLVFSLSSLFSLSSTLEAWMPPNLGGGPSMSQVFLSLHIFHFFTIMPRTNTLIHTLFLTFHTLVNTFLTLPHQTLFNWL